MLQNTMIKSIQQGHNKSNITVNYSYDSLLTLSNIIIKSPDIQINPVNPNKSILITNNDIVYRIDKYNNNQISQFAAGNSTRGIYNFIYKHVLYSEKICSEAFNGCCCPSSIGNTIICWIYGVICNSASLMYGSTTSEKYVLNNLYTNIAIGDTVVVSKINYEFDWTVLEFY